MGKKPQRRAGGPVPTWKPGDPTLTVSELAEALAPIAPDVPGTVQRIRHWTRERVLFPVDLQHAGAGKHRRYAVDAIYEAAILHTLTAVGLPVSGSRMLLDGLSKARFAVPKWRTARSKGQKWKPVLIISVTATSIMPGTFGPAANIGVYEEGEEVKGGPAFKVDDVVLTIKVDLAKLFAQVTHVHCRRVWTTKGGERHEAWVLDYYDQQGDRHTETYPRKKDAEARSAAVHVGIRAGTHTAASKSITVAEAAEDWITKIELDQRERTTIRQYRQHIDLHIVPRIGREKISGLTAPQITAFRDDLLTHLSRPLARKILTSLKSILGNAQKAGTVAQNVALAVSVGPDKRGRGKLKIGVDIPTVDEIKRILAATTGRARPFIITATFTGLRGSELRGLRWIDIDLKRSELHVRQRADRYNTIGSTKSEAGERTVPIGPLVVNTLREWKLACPPSQLGLVFRLAAATLSGTRTSSGRSGCGRRLPRVSRCWVRRAGRRSIPCCTPCGTSTRAGASMGRPTAA